MKRQERLDRMQAIAREHAVNDAVRTLKHA